MSKDFKNGFHSFLTGRSAFKREVVESKPASLLFVSFFVSCKALNGTAPPSCGRQVVQFSLRKEGWWQEEHPTVKTKIPGNTDYCCGRPKSGIKPPATPYINGSTARKEKKRINYF